jgi:dipeptidyl aminopeptidase/acylaminoacyl peptidase
MRQLMVAFALLCTATPWSLAGAAPPDAPAKTFQGRDLFGLQYAADPQIRPDGRAIAYSRMSFDIMNDRGRGSIWLIDTETGAQTPVVTGSGSHNSPRWSPKGDRLAYISTAQDGRPQLFVRWMQSGETARLAELLDAPDSLTWSPDGKWIAFTMFAPDTKPPLGEAPPKPENAQWAPPLEVITDITYRVDGGGYLKPGYTHVYVVPAEGGAPRQLTFGAFNESGPLSWAPDSSYIVATGNRGENWRREPVNTELYRISLADGAITQLTQRNGPDTGARISPDGKSIAYLSFEDKFMGYQNLELHLMNADGSNSRSLTAAMDRSIDNVEWAPDGRALYIQYDDHAVTKVARITLNGRVEPVAQGLSGSALDRPYTGGAFTVANATVAFTSGSSLRPSDVSIARGGRTRQLTNLNDALLGYKTLGQVQPLKVTSAFDQRPIDAWLVLPPNFDRNKKYPLILEIHGGPFAAYAPLFSTDYQLYAAAGYVVLYTNPRGSTSYGYEFANLIHHKYPGNDYDDLMSSVDAAIARGFVDADNLFVTGGSGGGVLTAWIVGKTTRFKAAATQKPVINWTSTVLTTDITTFMPKYWFDKMPWEDPNSYWERSPLSLVGNVKTPTLVVVGDQDFRTPLSDSEQYYTALQLAGVPTGLVKVPGASHGFTARPSQSAAKASAILAWFEKYRGKDPARPATTAVAP